MLWNFHKISPCYQPVICEKNGNPNGFLLLLQLFVPIQTRKLINILIRHELMVLTTNHHPKNDHYVTDPLCDCRVRTVTPNRALRGFWYIWKVAQL